MGRDLCARAAADVGLGAAAAGRRPARRAGIAAAAGRLRRIPGSTGRRPADEPGRDVPRRIARCRRAGGLQRGCRCAPAACRGLRAAAAPAHRHAAGRRRGHAPLRRPGLRRPDAVRGERAVRALRRRPCRGRARLAPAQRSHSRRRHRRDGAPGRVRPDDGRSLGRRRHGQVGDVRRHRGAGPRLHRPGLAGHAHRDRRRADRAQRHARAEGAAAARDCQRHA